MWARELRAAPPESTPPLRRGDRIQIFVQGQAALSGEFVVTEAGDCLHPVLGAVRVVGLQPEAVEQTLAIRLQNIVVNPVVSVRLSRAAPIEVNVVGEVRTPGRYEFTEGGTVIAALARAGWFTDFARPDRIFLIRNEASSTVPALRRIRFRLSDLTRPDPRAARFALEDGDLILVE